MRSSATLERAKSMLRERVSFYDEDRYFAPDIEAAKGLIRGRSLNGFVGPGLLPSL